MLKIDDNDINVVEEKYKVKFDDERRIAIKNMESKDIVACAGSGKTTMMCAKIDILANKQPFIKNKGIAVVSLTNVAIEQIKNKLGDNHGIFKYPNYCETIQKFVNNFVLNNWYNFKYNKKIKIIDNDFCVHELRYKIGNTKTTCLDNKKFLYEEVYTDGDVVYYKDENIDDMKLSGLSTKKRREYIECIKKTKLNLVAEGIFNFRDSFEISIKYLRNNSKIKKFIENRFEICFVDEMQDCRKWEKEFLDECFKNVCFQRIGDPNQQIYDETFWEPINPIVIKNSIRNPVNIANFAKKFEEFSTEMAGNVQNNIKVKFLVFKDEDILNVKETFINEIKKEKLIDKENAIFKIIGKVAKENSNGKIELIDYFRYYRRKKDIYL